MSYRYRVIQKRTLYRNGDEPMKTKLQHGSSKTRLFTYVRKNKFFVIGDHAYGCMKRIPGQNNKCGVKIKTRVDENGNEQIEAMPEDHRCRPYTASDKAKYGLAANVFIDKNADAVKRDPAPISKEQHLQIQLEEEIEKRKKAEQERDQERDLRIKAEKERDEERERRKKVEADYAKIPRNCLEVHIHQNPQSSSPAAATPATPPFSF